MSQRMTSLKICFAVWLTIVGVAWVSGSAQQGSTESRAAARPSPTPRAIAPYIGSPPRVVEQMLILAGLKAGETVYDLGCGDGRILIMAAHMFQALSVGVELNVRLYREALGKVKAAGLEESIRIIHGDLLKTNVGPADVVTLYLMPTANERVRPNLEKYLRHGARVVSHDFRVPGWTPARMRNIVDGVGVSHSLYLYTIPQKKP